MRHSRPFFSETCSGALQARCARPRLTKAFFGCTSSAVSRPVRCDRGTVRPIWVCNFLEFVESTKYHHFHLPTYPLISQQLPSIIVPPLPIQFIFPKNPPPSPNSLPFLLHHLSRILHPFHFTSPLTFPQLSTTQIHSPPPNHPDPSPTSPHLYFSLFPFSLTNWVLWYLQKAKRLLVVREPSEVERGDCQKFKPVRHKFTTPKVLWTIGYALWYELV